MPHKKEVALEVINIHKNFILPQHKNSTFKQTVVNIVKQNKKVTQKVLDGVSFSVNKGDFFGIVGRNGSGKSTLLKLIAGVYTPTSGEIKLHGGLTPFIELGVGFNPELSGRDNVYLNGALLGFDRKQMDSMYDEIVAFAELEQFMDQKLKNYSSGMQVRLAFSIAIKADNDILMFDEVLAVGDSNFQEKCLRQFRKFKREGKTIILVTHSMDMVDKFCNRALLINAGKVEYDGDADGAIDKYEILNMETSAKIAAGTKAQADMKLKISAIDIINSHGETVKIIDAAQDFSVKFSIDSTEEIDNVFMAIRICESENQFPIIVFDSEKDGQVLNIISGHNVIVVKIKSNPLIRGKYYLNLGLYDSPNRDIHFDHYNGLQNGNLFLIKGNNATGIIEVPRVWN